MQSVKSGINVSHCSLRILVIAATVFFQDGDPDDAPAGLFDAHDLIRDHIGKGRFHSSSLPNIYTT